MVERYSGIKLVRKTCHRVKNKGGIKAMKQEIKTTEAISFDPYTHGYYKVSGRVGEAFKDGLKLK